MRGAQNDVAEAIVIKHLGETRVSTRMWMRVREETQEKNRDNERRTLYANARGEQGQRKTF